MTVQPTPKPSRQSITPLSKTSPFRYLGDEIKYDEPSSGDAEIDLRKQQKTSCMSSQKNSSIKIFA